ncbi:MAG: DUF4276 family protein [Flammeovirgaceae bacterium]|nr:DUF4276 family protein [Flammeovirgaceae bacterium]
MLEKELKNEHVEFLLEEPSMVNLLEIILPKILPEGYLLDINCFLRPHQGKSDLKKSVPSKIRTFSNFYRPAKVIIIHDQDSNDCKELKKELMELCKKNGNCPVLIRIPCRELENWYLGDMDAIGKIYPQFRSRSHKYKAKFRDVDNIFGAFELEQIIDDFQKGYASKNIPKFMDIKSNKSISFNQLIIGIQKFLGG